MITSGNIERANFCISVKMPTPGFVEVEASESLAASCCWRSLRCAGCCFGCGCCCFCWLVESWLTLEDRRDRQVLVVGRQSCSEIPVVAATVVAMHCCCSVAIAAAILQVAATLLDANGSCILGCLVTISSEVLLGHFVVALAGASSVAGFDVAAVAFPGVAAAAPIVVSGHGVAPPPTASVDVAATDALCICGCHRNVSFWNCFRLLVCFCCCKSWRVVVVVEEIVVGVL